MRTLLRLVALLVAGYGLYVGMLATAQLVGLYGPFIVWVVLGIFVAGVVSGRVWSWGER